MNAPRDLGADPMRVGDVIISHDGNHVEATLDRPDVRNAINWGVIEGLDAAMDVAEDREASLLTIRGAHGTFCSGADLRLLRTLLDDAIRMQDFIGGISDTLTRLTRAPAVVLAIVEGHALAGGCELLLACDLSISRDDAQIGDGHLTYSMLPGGGASVRLPQQIAVAQAKYLLYTGLALSGTEAAQCGLVSRSIEPERFEDGVSELVERLCSLDPQALRGMKEMVSQVATLDHEKAFQTELAHFLDFVVEGSAAAAGLQRFFSR